MVGGWGGAVGVRESTLAALTTRNLHFSELGVGLGFSECWPKKKPGQNGPSKNCQIFWPAGQKNHSFLTQFNKKKGQKIILASQFCIHDLFSSCFCWFFLISKPTSKKKGQFFLLANQIIFFLKNLFFGFLCLKKKRANKSQNGQHSEMTRWRGGPICGYFSIEKYYFKKAVDLQKFAAVFQHLKWVPTTN